MNFSQQTPAEIDTQYDEALFQQASSLGKIESTTKWLQDDYLSDSRREQYKVRLNNAKVALTEAVAVIDAVESEFTGRKSGWAAAWRSWRDQDRQTRR